MELSAYSSDASSSESGFSESKDKPAVSPRPLRGLPASVLHGGSAHSPAEATPSIFKNLETPPASARLEAPAMFALQQAAIRQERLGRDHEDENHDEEDDEQPETEDSPTTVAPAKPRVEAPFEHPSELSAVKQELWQLHGDEQALARPQPESEQPEYYASPVEMSDVVQPVAAHEQPLTTEAPADDWQKPTEAPVVPTEMVATTPPPAHEFTTIHLDEAHEGELVGERPPTPPPLAESTEQLEQLFAAPAAELPSDHPEAVAESLPPLSEQEQFQDIMQRADIGGDFIAATSPPESVRPPYDYDPASITALPTSEHIATAAPLSGVGEAISAATAWHQAKQSAEAGVMAGVAGAAAGAVAGGVAGRMVGEHGHAQQRAVQQEVRQRDQQLAALANEQQQTNQMLEHLNRQNQDMQQRFAAEQPPAPILQAPMAPERLSGPVETAYQPTSAAAPERPTSPSATMEQVPPAATVMPALAPERMPLATDEHLERSASYYAVVNNRGEAVHRQGVNEFGQEMQYQQHFEAAPPEPAQTAQASAPTGAQHGAYMAGQYQPIPGAVNPMLDSGQVDAQHELAGYADQQHLLPPPRNPVVTTLKSPLLWVGVVILLIAYFAAAFL